MPLDERALEILARHRAERTAERRELTAEHFAEQHAFNTDGARLAAACCGRRAGKTKGRNEAFLEAASTTRGGRFLLINETRGELHRLNWIGNRGDGIATLAERHQLPCRLDNSALSVHFPAIDSWIYLVGVDDERALRKALGGAYHEVWWDEAQKIPSRFEEAIREVLMPTLLDFGGRFRLTGSPARQTSGLFYNVTRPELDKRIKGWSVHAWNLLRNPYFGAVIVVDGKLYVRARLRVVAGPFADPAEARTAALAARMEHGLEDLRRLLGGPPMDSPIMQREGLGRWTYEATSYVYAVRAHDRAALCYAPHRPLAGHPQGFPDLPGALADLPGWKEGRPYFFSLGGDLGFFPDPFGVVLWGWSHVDRHLYEVASWKQTELTSDWQHHYLAAIQAVVPCGVTVLDAGGPAKATVQGWLQGWVDRHPLPAAEADKHNKHTHIELMNTEIRTLVDGVPAIRFRDGGPLLDEMWDLQWSSIVSSTGRLIEDPTQPNHCTDGALYAHRHSYAHRFRNPPPPPPPEGSPEWALRAEAELEEAVLDDFD